MGTNSKFVSENKLFFKVIIREIGKNNTHSSMTYSGNQQKKEKKKCLICANNFLIYAQDSHMLFAIVPCKIQEASFSFFFFN